MRLHQLDINNFRKLKKCTIKFRDTTFLIGPNNAGKSSVFAALEFLHRNKSTDREDFSKEYAAENDDYEYAKEIVLEAEYQNLPDEAKNWVGFKGRIIETEKPLPGETNNSMVYRKVWSLSTLKPKVFMKEFPRTVSDNYKACKIVSDLAGGDFTEEFLKEHFGEANYTKALSTQAVKNKLTDLPQYWNIDQTVKPNWVENPGGIPGNVLSKLPEIITIPAESCMYQLTSQGGALHKLLGDLFENVRKKSKNYEQAQVDLLQPDWTAH